MSADATVVARADAAVQSAGAVERMHIVVTGHVDHGKSTILGRLLADSGSLPRGKLEAVRAACARHAKPFEYAFLVDALRDEQAQGITIDAATVFFRTARRYYAVIDAPGHVEFLKNMITGASRAEGALLVIDAGEGIKENSRRHAFMLSMLGIGQIAVLINKMDLVGYCRDVFDGIVAEYRGFLTSLGVTPAWFIPVSGLTGENVLTPSDSLSWYGGPTVLDALESFHTGPSLASAAFRMPVQGVYKFTEHNDTRRIVAGTIDSGRIRSGDEVIFYPSGKKSRVDRIEGFNRAPRGEAVAGEAIGFTLTNQIYLARGDIAVLAADSKPYVSTRMKVSLFWLGRSPLVTTKDYVLKLGTSRMACRVERVHRVIDASDLSVAHTQTSVERHDVAECTLTLAGPLAFDVADGGPSTSRFVIVDDYEISGGGIVREALTDGQDRSREKLLTRRHARDAGGVSAERRMKVYGQRPVLLVITGGTDLDRKALARDLEAQLFAGGRYVYVFGIDSELGGVDAGRERTHTGPLESLRRFGAIANILLDAGLIVIATAAVPKPEDLDVIRTSGCAGGVITVWLGDRVTADVGCDLALTVAEAGADGAARLETLLLERGAIFTPW